VVIWPPMAELVFCAMTGADRAMASAMDNCDTRIRLEEFMGIDLLLG
jgi:hypothetical protein